MKINLTGEVNDHKKLGELYSKIVRVKKENEEIENIDQALIEFIIKAEV